MTNIHPTSLVDAGCKLASGVEIGPFCVLGPDVEIGEGTRLISHVAIMSSTSIGRGCTIWPNAVLGAAPQVSKRDDPSRAALVIGDNVTIREGVTIHLGTEGKDKPTRVGNGCLLMANAHVAHDCQLGDNVTLVQGAGLAGHCDIRRGATIGGLAGLHQYVIVGQNSFVGGGAIVTHDVLPYSIVTGNRAKTTGVNIVGLRRLGWQEARIASLRASMLAYFQQGDIRSADEHGDVLTSFLKEAKRGICRPAPSFEKSRI